MEVIQFENKIKLKKPKNEGKIIYFTNEQAQLTKDENLIVKHCKEISEVKSFCLKHSNFKETNFNDLTFKMLKSTLIYLDLKIDDKTYQEMEKKNLHLTQIETNFYIKNNFFDVDIRKFFHNYSNLYLMKFPNLNKLQEYAYYQIYYQFLKLFLQ